jgi:hypothetical protein
MADSIPYLATIQFQESIVPYILSRKLKSWRGARNRFQEPSLELSSQAT